MMWQDLFPVRILERGYEYFMAGAVDDFEVREAIVNAVVEGSEHYVVTIEYTEDQITELHCDCPYAAEGNNCKHMVAVLFMCEERNVFHGQNSAQRSDTAEELEKIVMTADETMIRSFLLSAIVNDEKLAHQFAREFLSNYSAESVRYIINQIADIFDTYEDYSGFIDYHNAFTFGGDILGLLTDEVDPLIEANDYSAAFEVLGYLVNRVDTVEMDDSGGEITMILSECFERWQTILAEVKLNKKKRMFDWFTKKLAVSDDEYSKEYVEEIIRVGFPEASFVEVKLRFAKKMIEEAEAMEGWRREFQLSEWAVFLIEMMEQEGKSEVEVRKQYTRYWAFSEVRKKYIANALARKDYSTAIKTLEESIKLDNSYPGLVSEYSHVLKAIYNTLGDKDRYLDQLWQLLLTDDPGNIEIFRELKANYTKEEWPAARQRIYSALEGKDFMDRLYLEEKDYEQLMTYVEDSFELYKAREHFDLLKDRFPERMLDKYEKELRQLAAPVSNRQKYRAIANLMKGMTKISGGNLRGKRLMQEFKTNYPRRKAMLDELSKLKSLY